MQEYYYLQNNEQRGPVTLEQLRALNVSQQTLVWTEGMAGWKPAGQLPELTTKTPPTTPLTESRPSTQTQQDTAGNSNIDPFADIDPFTETSAFKEDIERK